MRRILAFIGGVLLGSGVNMLLILIGSIVVPLPDGADPTDAEAIKKAMPHFTALHFVFPFLAHALGTLIGAIAGTRIGAVAAPMLPMAIAALFLIGGIVNALSLPAPAVFVTLDLVLAYLPMGYLGWRIGRVHDS